MWQDLKFDLKHFRHIERLAMIGDKKWEKGMSVFCKPFTTAKIRYFDAYRSGWVPANLIQAQRDYFRAHTYERLDTKGTFHTEWENA